MNIAILGSGAVAQTLAAGFLQHGDAVTLGTRDPATLAPWLEKNVQANVASVAEAAAFGEMAVLCVKGEAAQVVLAAAAPTLAGKTVIDTTNPISDAPPEGGVLRFFCGTDDSLMERLQRAHPDVHLVKAFNSVGNARMVNPHYAEGRPTMFICGDDAAAKATVTTLLDAFGWEVADMGGVQAARAIEPLCMLWCIPGFLRNEWGHAFKLLS